MGNVRMDHCECNGKPEYCKLMGLRSEALKCGSLVC